MEDDDDWVKFAKVEDAVVAELLLRLKGDNMIAPPPTASTSTPKPAFLIEWRVRQRRSKAVTVQLKDPASRDSPSTPLSFSCGTAVSVSFERGIGSGGSGSGGGLDCCLEEDSSTLSVAESAPKASSMTRSKTLAEDKLLLIEKMQLQKEPESVDENLKIERARNDKFKRIKLQEMEYVNPSQVTSCLELKKEESSSKFELPDLNMPLEDNLSYLC